MLVAVLDVAYSATTMTGVTFGEWIIDQEACLEIVLALLEQGHRCTGIHY